MPAPKSRRKEASGSSVPPAAIARVADASCLCESQEAPHGCWVAPPSVANPFDEAKLREMRAFVAALKGNARDAVLRTTPVSEFVPQVCEAATTRVVGTRQQRDADRRVQERAPGPCCGVCRSWSWWTPA